MNGKRHEMLGGGSRLVDEPYRGDAPAGPAPYYRDERLTLAPGPPVSLHSIHGKISISNTCSIVKRAGKPGNQTVSGLWRFYKRGDSWNLPRIDHVKQLFEGGHIRRSRTVCQHSIVDR